MTLTAVLIVALVCVAWLVPVPYAAMSPGPTANVLGEAEDHKPIIEIDGHRVYKTSGRLDLTTVAVSSPDQKLDLVSVLKGWLDPETAIVPYDYLYPGDPTPQQVEQRNAEAMQTSQQTAIAAALRQAGERVTPVVQVQAVVEKTPAVGKLRAGDTIVAVDGTRVTDREQVVELVGRHRPGEQVRFSIRRDGEPREVTITTTRAPDDPDRAFVGITPHNGFEFPFEVTVNLGQEIGGPSAGAMFALAIFDKLTPGALTGGQHIAGTGTIEPDGTIGPIGGIQQKIIGAREEGATTFLVPAANCADAVSADVDGIRLVKVETLDGAVKALERLAKDRDAKVPACAR
ncbi:PDZ domain-containing protein [Thermasporomyces composti]|jgi:PDZ domain-containing protein|uniref:endopeptidase La n=2 Tax=Thermasporomyces composti TaxID=696763 RepID=A0A3D9VBF8_THECX|nr:PDZ domain-containing protein [Thermasporomyces composti]